MKEQDDRPLKEKVDSSIEAVRIERKELELRFLRNSQVMLLLMLIIASGVFIFAVSQFHIPGSCFAFAFLAIIATILTRSVRLYHASGKIIQGNALRWWIRATKGSSLKYALVCDRQKKHDAVANIVVLIILHSIILPVTIFACYRAAYFGGTTDIAFCVIGLVCTVIIVRVAILQGPEIKSVLGDRRVSKTMVETENFPLVIAEENNILIRQYCKPDELYRCTAEVSFVLLEKDVILSTSKHTSVSQDMTTKRAELRILEHKFDKNDAPYIDAPYYEFSFPVFLSPDEYIPSTCVRFLSGAVEYRWCLRLKLRFPGGTVVKRDFPVIITPHS